MLPFDPQPTLAGPLVVLRPLRSTDWKGLFAVVSDPLIWAGHPTRDRWREPVFRAFFDAAIASGGALAALHPVTGALIGSSRYDRSRAEAGEIEIGWTFLAREHWGGRINRAMKRLMIAHALLHFDRVIFFVGADNIRSRRALDGIGARLTKRAHDTDVGASSVRHLIYSLNRNDFAAGPLSRD